MLKQLRKFIFHPAVLAPLSFFIPYMVFAYAISVNPVFTSSAGPQHNYSATQFTAQTDKDTYNPGETITVSGIRPFQATCSNSAVGSIQIIFDGQNLNGTGNSCPYSSASICKSAAEHCKMVGPRGDQEQVCSESCNSRQTYSICNDADLHSILSSIPPKSVDGGDADTPYIISLTGNSNYSIQLKAATTPGAHQIQVLIALNGNLNQGDYAPVSASIPYTVADNTPLCQNLINSTSYGWTQGSSLQPGGSIARNDLTSIRTDVEQEWANAGMGQLTDDTLNGITDRGGEPIVSHQTTIAAGHIDALQYVLKEIYTHCGLTPLQLHQVLPKTPIRAGDFNELRRAVEGVNK